MSGGSGFSVEPPGWLHEVSTTVNHQKNPTGMFQTPCGEKLIWRNDMKKTAAMICLVFAIQHLKASLVTFNFAGTDPGQHAPWNTGTAIGPNATTPGFALGTGLSGVGGVNRFNASAWNEGFTDSSAISGGDYFGFTITIAPGYAANFNGSQITLTLQSSWNGSTGTGPGNYALFSSIGGFASGDELQSGAIAGTQSFTFNFGSSGFDYETGGIEFRV